MREVVNLRFFWTHTGFGRISDAIYMKAKHDYTCKRDGKSKKQNVQDVISKYSNIFNKFGNIAMHCSKLVKILYCYTSTADEAVWRYLLN